MRIFGLNSAKIPEPLIAEYCGFLTRLQEQFPQRAFLHQKFTQGKTYVTVLAKYGITAVLKHFPGLGRVPADTHHFSARLDASIDILLATDWMPFREISRNTKAGIMLGHVTLTSIDPDHPTSGSLATVRFLREKWGITGLLVTDDFSMAPLSHGPGGIARAAENSMVAGVDLILLSYDAAAVYDLLGAEL